MVRDWVNLNPLPTLLLFDDQSLFYQNSGFRELMAELDTDHVNFLSATNTAAKEGAQSKFTYPADLKTGECVVKPVILGDNRRAILHLTKLAVEPVSCTCCMILPGSDPSDANLSGILNSVESLILQIDGRGNVSFVNTRLRELLGYERTEQERISHLRQIEVNFGEETLTRRIEEVRSRGLARYRGHFRHVGGSHLPVEISLVASSHPGDSSFYLHRTRHHQSVRPRGRHERSPGESQRGSREGETGTRPDAGGDQ